MTRNESESELKVLFEIPRRNFHLNKMWEEPCAVFKRNPELFRVSPRPGGFLKVLVPTRSQDFATVSHHAKFCKESCPTVFQRTESISSPSKLTIKPKTKLTPHKVDCCLSTPSSATASESDFNTFYSRKEDPLTCQTQSTCTQISVQTEEEHASAVLQKSMDMLAETISCTMQIAANLDVPFETLKCAESYLRCMKNKRGAHPKNVHILLCKIRNLLKAKQERNGEVIKIFGGTKSSKSSIGSSVFNSCSTINRYNPFGEKL